MKDDMISRNRLGPAGKDWTKGNVFKNFLMLSWPIIINQIFIMIGMGLGIAAGVLAGQNLGAGQPDRAERSGWLAAGFAEFIMIICSVSIFLWAEHIVCVFSTDPPLVAIAGTFLRITLVGYLVLGFIPLFMQFLSGVGDTLPPLIFEVVALWLITMPLAILLPRMTGLGVNGVRWAIVVGMFAGAIAYVTYFRLGRWKSKRV
jgi:Na+-driven multidrug efflux pump